MEVLEFYDVVESKRMARLETLVQKQKSIESPLIKVSRQAASCTNSMIKVVCRVTPHQGEKQAASCTNSMIKLG